ncbi:iron-containing redox enzyme family protein [Chitinimonas lacunae]|uniref:Iron-containing redox enzyme family protein n=1 Tax=Chitinimonas lacunae TaxID=1963018 RepID=A0ABV8MN14_9NEIS
MVAYYDRVFLVGSGMHYPGPPIDNEAMDGYIAPLNRTSGRIKRRILAENGILTRHYALNPDGSTACNSWQLAAAAVRDCLDNASVPLTDISLLCTGSSGGDTILPGFANMLQGELGAPPLETLSSQGVCAAGVTALQYAAEAIERGRHRLALVAAAELPSRLFKRSRFAPRGFDSDFNAHFLRWMLSDGAGAWLLADAARADGLSLRLRWSHCRSFSGDFPVCMQLGYPEAPGRSYLDYPSAAEAEADGALALRQDIRLLPNLFDVGIHEYVRLIHDGQFDPAAIDHFLCHYSSEKFAPLVEKLMSDAGLSIPRERWYSNLTWRGNTGAASIFAMLTEFLRSDRAKPGQQILCFVPESGRFTVAFMLFEVVTPQSGWQPVRPRGALDRVEPEIALEPVDPPHAPEAADPQLAELLRRLAGVWHDYRSRVWRSEPVRRILAGRFSCTDYQRWMACWIPQVREGSRWMRCAIANMGSRHHALVALIGTHAAEEQFDFDVLFQDYRLAGGPVEQIDQLRRNPGGEALNAYLHRVADSPDPVGLLGAIYLIEGTGQRIVPLLLPRLKRQLDGLPAKAFRFLDYHGANDEHHLARWLEAVKLTLEADPTAAEAIVGVARRTAELYLMQWEDMLG